MAADPTAAARLRCLVPFCHATRGLRRGETRLPAEWICTRHWRAVSPAAKARKRLTERRERRLARAGREVSIAMRQAAVAWAHCKVEAIETAAGIASIARASEPRS